MKMNFPGKIVDSKKVCGKHKKIKTDNFYVRYERSNNNWINNNVRRINRILKKKNCKKRKQCRK
jgi:hypothetical protein